MHHSCWESRYIPVDKIPWQGARHSDEISLLIGNEQGTGTATMTPGPAEVDTSNTQSMSHAPRFEPGTEDLRYIDAVDNTPTSNSRLDSPTRQHSDVPNKRKKKPKMKQVNTIINE